MTSPLTTGPLAGLLMGEGTRATILLHGFLGSGKNLRTLATRWLARDPARRFVLPDLTGHGDSPPLSPGATLDTVARDVLDTADRAGLIGPLTLVGHSLGGRVALAVARIAAERLSGVVLLDIGPGPIDPARSESRHVLDVILAAPDEAPQRAAFRAFFLARGLSPALTEWVLMNVQTEGDRAVWRIDRHALDGLHETFNRDDLRPVVTARAVPIRCIRGGRSSYVPEAEAHWLVAAGCPVVTLPEAGHYVHVDALDALVDELAR